MKTLARMARPGVLPALGAALLFGAGTPLAKRLLQGSDPWVLAGLLYLGSGARLPGLALGGAVMLLGLLASATPTGIATTR